MIHARPTRTEWKAWRPPAKEGEPPVPRPDDTAEQILSDALGPRTNPYFLSTEVMYETNRRYAARSGCTGTTREIHTSRRPDARLGPECVA